MPELPEVEDAANRLRPVVTGRRIVAVHTLHPVATRALPSADAAALVGRRVLAVERWAKHQRLVLDDGARLEAHFRMAGDWHFGRTDEAPPRYARAALDLDDGVTVTLVDGRAFGYLRRFPPGALPPDPSPDALDPAFDAAYLADVLRGRRVAIKPVLLEQDVVGGIGNIYAAEALWRAQIDPRVPAGTLGPRRLGRLVPAIRETLRDAIASPGRYADGEALERLAVYDRAGQPCSRCGTPVRRFVQVGRSTYHCPSCQKR